MDSHDGENFLSSIHMAYTHVYHAWIIIIYVAVDWISSKNGMQISSSFDMILI